jgi:hypothetical protein
VEWVIFTNYAAPKRILMAFETTSWQIGNVTINEPMTAVTDLLVAAVCFYAFFKRNGHVKYEWTHVFFRYYFLFLGLATMYGGLVGHAFIHYLSFEWKLPGWIISMISIALVERATIMHAKPYMPYKVGKFFSVLNVIELAALLFCVVYFMNFSLVEAHAAYGLLIVVVSFELVVYIKSKQKSALYMLIAVCVGIMAAIVHLAKVIPHKWFNHLDLSHIFMAISAYVFYLGAKRIPYEEKK